VLRKRMIEWMWTIQRYRSGLFCLYLTPIEFKLRQLSHNLIHNQSYSTFLMDFGASHQSQLIVCDIYGILVSSIQPSHVRVRGRPSNGSKTQKPQDSDMIANSVFITIENE